MRHSSGPGAEGDGGSSFPGSEHGDHAGAFESVDLALDGVHHVDSRGAKEQPPQPQQRGAAATGEGREAPSFSTRAGARGRRGSEAAPAPAEWRRHARHFREMVRKRALAASRDGRGAVFTLLLPVLAVAAVLVSRLHPARSRHCGDTQLHGQLNHCIRLIVSF